MIREGTKVHWNRGEGTEEGKVVESYTHKVIKNIAGYNIARNGQEENRALLIEQADGHEVLKLESEVKEINETSDEV